jgi:hypothetical protein
MENNLACGIMKQSVWQVVGELGGPVQDHTDRAGQCLFC